MKPNKQQPSEPSTESKPDPKFIAQQLRRPSGSFADKISLMMNKVNKPLYDLMFDVMELHKGDYILEIGFGNGKFFDGLFLKEPELQVSGIDFSDAMIASATTHNRDAISSRKLELKQASSEAIPFPDQTFDSVFCNMVIYFWDQPEKHLKEVHRVLKPGGTFYTGMRALESVLVFPFVQHGFNLYSTEEWKEVLDKNGFSGIDMLTRRDPEIEVEGKKVQLESCCIFAVKK